MNILIKIPSRERPHKFFLVIKQYFDMAYDKNIRFLATLDADDPMIEKYIHYCNALKSSGLNIEWVVGLSSGKIHAVNRDMNKSGEWDIVVLASDDMICKVQNWDFILSNEIESYFPDTDGVLYHRDGKTQLNTMVIMGRKFAEKMSHDVFGLKEIVIYHPDYISLWCDNFFMDLSRSLGKEKIFEQVLFEHEHYSTHRNIQPDAMMLKNQKFYHQDEATYYKHKNVTFKHIFT